MRWWPQKVLRGCAGKRRHKSQGKAEAHVRALKKVEDPEADRLTTYFCVRCHGYHVGHKDRFH